MRRSHRGHRGLLTILRLGLLLLLRSGVLRNGGGGGVEGLGVPVGPDTHGTAVVGVQEGRADRGALARACRRGLAIGADLHKLVGHGAEVGRHLVGG